MNNWYIEPLAQLAEHFEGPLWERAVAEAAEENPWFTPRQISHAVSALRERMLKPERLQEWLSAYRKPSEWKQKRVGIVMAGNLPLVGFADLAAVLAVGHKAVVKPSSKDRVLMEYVIRHMPGAIDVADRLDADRLDGVIATGGNDARQAFENNYRGLPALLRGTRQSVAVLNGTETDFQLRDLSEDMFRYWGMGCRSVTRLFVPVGMDMRAFAARLTSFASEDHPAYADCCRYAKTMAQMHGAEWVDGGFFVLRRVGLSEPDTPKPAEVLWTEYTEIQTVWHWLKDSAVRLQCIVGQSKEMIPFGQSQHPGWTDYADGIDTVEFLLNL